MTDALWRMLIIQATLALSVDLVRSKWNHARQQLLWSKFDWHMQPSNNKVSRDQ